MTLTIKTGDWAFLANGVCDGPLMFNETNQTFFVRDVPFIEWETDGSCKGGSKEMRIIAALPCSPLERIRQLEDALRPFAEVCEHDIGLSEASEELFRPMSSQYARAPLLKVGHFRDARRALGESK